MKKSIQLFSVFFLAILISTSTLFAQRQTYQVGETTYILGENYSTTGLPKVQRSSSNKKEFLNSLGYESTPKGYEVDHIIPLSKGGTDSPYNMQLLTKDQHKAKTSLERFGSNNFYSISNTSNPTNSPGLIEHTSIGSGRSWSSGSTYELPKMKSIPSGTIGRTIYTGSRGGQYYYNSKGNKTYLKQKR